MTIAPPSATTPIPQTNTAEPAIAPPSALTSDFDTFLQLLTAQIRNQDPLDPMKSEEFAVQLATFSGVEQSVRTNDLLEAILAGSGGDEFMSMSNWIGREVRAQMPGSFTGDPVHIDPLPPVAGSHHELVVRDAAGTEIARRPVDPLGGAIAWDGLASDGTQAAQGTYTFDVESFEDGELVASESAPIYALVQEIRYSATGPTLAFAGGIEIEASTVSAVREAEAT